MELTKQLAESDYTNPQLESLIMELQTRLKNHKGKKQYGYLQPRVKNIVDEIVDQLCQEPNISKAYDQWCDLQDELVHGYSDITPPRILLSQQKEFKSIKNMIIGEVDKFSNFEYQFNFEEITEQESLVSGVRAVLLLANSYNNKDSTHEEKEFAETLYNQILDDLENIESADFNQFLNKHIGRLYLDKNNIEMAIKWLHKSADQDNPYAQKYIDFIQNRHKENLQFGIQSLLKNIANLFHDKLPQDSTTMNLKIDSKALRKLREQKQARGLKHTGEDLQTIEQQFN